MEELLTKINKVYGITVSSSEKVERGSLSENHILSDGEKKFFLKKYRFDTPHRIEEIHRAKKYFAEGGIPAILPISLLDGKTFFEHSGSYYTLFPFVNGEHREGETLTDTASISLGTMLGRIHLRGKQSTLQINDYFKITDREKVFKKMEDILDVIHAKDSLDAFDTLALETIELKKSLLEKNTLSFEDFHLNSDHLIHGDYLVHNVFFDTNQQVQYVFDFEKTGYAPRVFEVFRSMFFSFLTDDVEEKKLENAKKYLDAYTSVYPMSKEERIKGLQLVFLKTINSFWVEGEHYLKNNLRTDPLLFENNKRIKYLSENLETLTEFLIK